MPTYRCRSCGAVWPDPDPNGMRVFHSCPPDRVTDKQGTRTPIAHPRDENIVQRVRGGPVHIKSTGLGRELIDELDLVTGASPEQLAAVFARPSLGLAPLEAELTPEEEADTGPFPLR